MALPLMPALFGTARRITGSTADAEDLVQETYLRAFAGLHGFERGSSIHGWMYTILRRARTDDFRRRARRPRTISDPEREVAVTAPQAALASGWETLARELDRLPACYRAVVLLRFVEDLSYAEIAQRLRLPLGTVMSRIFRGRRRLRACLRQGGLPGGAAVSPAAANRGSAASSAVSTDIRLTE